MAYAKELLRELGAIDTEGVITPHGKAMAELPLHPRLAHMVIRGHDLGLGGLACALAALLGERDIAKGAGAGPRDVDLRWRLEIVAGESERDSAPHGLRVDMNAVRQIRKLASDWRRQIGAELHKGSAEEAGLLVALAYPDRVAKKRGGGVGSFLLSNGRGARLDPLDALSNEAYLAVAEVDGAQADARIFLAAPISEAEIEAHLGEAIETRSAVEWDERTQAVLAREQRRLGSLVLREKPLANPSAEMVQQALLAAIRKVGLDATLPWTPGLRQWQARVNLLRRHLPAAADWPDMNDAALTERLEDWLAPYLQGITKLSQLANIDLHAALTHQLDYTQQKLLDAEAPDRLVVEVGQVDDERFELRGRTDPLDEVMAGSRLDRRQRARDQVLGDDVLDSHVHSHAPAPLLGIGVEPPVVAGHVMCPLEDRQRALELRGRREIDGGGLLLRHGPRAPASGDTRGRRHAKTRPGQLEQPAPRDACRILSHPIPPGVPRR